MLRRAISVTLDADNLAWIEGRARAAGLRSVSELLDQLVTAARETGRIGPLRSVIGTVDIDANDPLLERAGEAIRAFFDDLFGNPACQPLDVSPETVFVADQLRFTRDPFDALICAAAQTVGLPLIPRGADIRGSGTVKVIW